MKTYIYSLSNPVTNEVRYIGKTVNLQERYKYHLCTNRKHGTTHSKAWIKSLKAQNLIPKMEIVDEVLTSEWEFWEQYWISQFKVWGFNLTNHQIGGGQSNIGTKFSNETKLKMSLAQLGKKHTPEAKEKQRLKQLGVIPSVETREKLRISNTGKKQPLSAIAKTVAGKQKPVIQYDLKTGEKIAEYISAIVAQEALGGKGNNLGSHLKGKRPHYMGYRFEYKSKVNI